MNVMFPSKYLKADDIIEAGGEMTLKIKAVEMESLKKQDGTEEQKPVTSFVGVEKSLILNKTNAGRIVAILGNDDTDFWAGETITLTTEMVDAFGKTQHAIRVKLDAPSTSTGKNLDKSSEFWAYAYSELKLTPAEGNAIIAENDGDIAKAYEAIRNKVDEKSAQADML